MFGMKIKEITADDLEKKIKNKEPIIIIDVCEPYEFEIRSIENAINISLYDLDEHKIEKIQGISKDSEIIVYCAHGVRSKRATAFLNSLGYKNVYSLIGGIASFLKVDF